MKKNKSTRTIILGVILLGISSIVSAQLKKFPWPEGKKMALSLSFDDARTVQLTSAVPLLNEYGIKATFFLTVSSIIANKTAWAWRIVAKEGHEIGNHTMNHPCSINYGFSGSHSLENLSMADMKKELLEANRKIKQIIGVKPVVFAYPCGQTYIGRGTKTQSYVPLVAKYFLAGRDWLGEEPVDPWECDMAQLTGMTMGDDMYFKDLLPLLERAKKGGRWLILVGHNVGMGPGQLNTRISLLRKLCKYATDPKNHIWIAPVGTIAQYVKKIRKKYSVNYK